LTLDYRFGAKKSLGQNYLQDPNIIRKIIESASIQAEDNLLEVGPGPGALTNALIASPAHHVISIEKDHQFIPHWQSAMDQNPKFCIMHGDALKVKLNTLSPQTPFKIVANLPYNVGTQIIINWLEELPLIQSMTLMLQKEVVSRIVAAPGTKDYGRLSILIQWLCKAERRFDVPPTAFRPQPKVTSSILHLVPREMPLFPAEKYLLEKVTALAFQQRRKMIKKSLQGLFDNTEARLETLGIDPTARPETLSIEEFCRIADALPNPL
jgi:16S rRNA (adenine1518-N6/adenine1519-N6)-dimethyltransferase